MMKINAAVCDDNAGSLRAVAGALSGIFGACGIDPDVDVFPSADALLRAAEQKRYKIAFLDIDMPGIDGIECGRRLRAAHADIEIIYVSAREERVFESFAVRPFAFVRKSHFLSDAAEAVRHYAATHSPDGSDKSISLSVHGGTVNVQLSDIVYFEGSGVYQQMHTKGSDKPVEVVSRMERLEEELAPYGFMRVHKGYLVNYAHIKRLDGQEVTVTGGEKLPLSRRKAPEIKKKYLEFGRKYGVLMV